jgi:hypothetical protein
MNRFKWITAATLLAGMAFATPQARAAALVPGGTSVPTAYSDPLAATILNDTGVQNYSVSGGGASMTGTGEAWVVTNYASNPFGSNDLTFVYQISLTGGTNASGKSSIVERLTMSAFDSFSTDVGYFATGAQKIPPLADRSGDGDVVGFDYRTNVINVGDTTALLVINTNAVSYKTGSLSVQDGLTANLNGFSPTAAPEPSTVATALTGLGLVGLGALRRKFRNPA